VDSRVPAAGRQVFTHDIAAEPIVTDAEIERGSSDLPFILSVRGEITSNTISLVKWRA